MATQVIERREISNRIKVPWISWGAIFGGLASGMALFILLALLGMAAGFTAIEPQEVEPVGNVPLITGIWTGISMLLAAFVGGYVATRMSGLSRRVDGVLHGLVAWGVTTLFLFYLVTTSVGALLGGAFSFIGKGAQSLAGAAGQAASSPAARNQLDQMITGLTGGANITPEATENLRQRLSAGDREGAIDVMVNQMGVASDRAATVADQGIALYGTAQDLPERGREIAQTAVSGLSRASWFLFAGLFLSMLLGMGGGFLGSRSTVRRRTPLPVI